MSPELIPILIAVLAVLVINVVIFLIFREFFCWYWKINKTIAIQEKQMLLLESMVRHFNGEFRQGEELESIDPKAPVKTKSDSTEAANISYK